MKTDKEKKSNYVGKYSPSRLDKRLYVYLICLFFSILFWFLTTLNRDYISDVTYNASFVNLPVGKILVKDLPSKIKIRVEASGFTMLGVRYDAKKDTLFIDASSVLKYLNNDDGLEVYYLLLNNQLAAMGEQLGSSIKVKRIVPDTVTFLFDKKDEKIVPVKLNLKYSFARQHQQNGDIKIIPSKIIIRGPKSVLKDITYLETELYKLSDLTENTSAVIPLKQRESKGKLEVGIGSVVAQIKVEKYTETEIDLPITVLNIPFGYKVNTFPKTIKLKLKVPLSKYEQLSPELFSIVGDMKQLTNFSSNRLKLSIDKYPNFVNGLSLESPYVEFIIRKI
jgi:hypothetical protein